LEQVGFAAVLRENPNFRRIWIGQVGSLLGDWFNTVALLSLLLRLTGSGRAAGIFYVVQMIPVFLASPLAGRVVDLLPRKTVMIGADVLRAVVVLSFLFVTKPERIWIVYAATALQMTLSAFFEPARNAVTPRVVRPAHLFAANALTAATWSTMLAVGAAIGGGVTALFGERISFLLNSASYLWSAIFVARASIPLVEKLPAHAHIGEGFLEGLRAALRLPALLPVLCVKGLIGVSGGIGLVLAVMGDRTFRIGKSAAAGIGMLFAARGIGTAIGPIVARRLGSATGAAARKTIGSGFAISAVAFTVACLPLALPVVLAALVVSGIGTAIPWVFSTIVLQAETEDHLRGRVFAADQALLTLTVSFSMLATGHWLDHPGWTPRGVGMGLAAGYVVSGTIFVLLLLRARARSAPVDAAARLE
jgi:MFS family permease